MYSLKVYFNAKKLAMKKWVFKGDREMVKRYKRINRLNPNACMQKGS